MTLFSELWQEVPEIWVGAESRGFEPKLEFQGVFVPQCAQLIDKFTCDIVERLPIGKVSQIWQECDRTEVRGGDRGDNSMFDVSRDSRDDLEPAKLWAKRESHRLIN